MKITRGVKTLNAGRRFPVLLSVSERDTTHTFVGTLAILLLAYIQGAWQTSIVYQTYLNRLKLSNLIRRRLWSAVLLRLRQRPLEVCELLIEDAELNSVLHTACRHQAPDSVIEALLKIDPKLAVATNIHGEVPLHWAVRFHNDKSIISRLIIANPKTAYVHDKQGCTPFKLMGLGDLLRGHLIDCEGQLSNEQRMNAIAIANQDWGYVLLLLKAAYFHQTKTHFARMLLCIQMWRDIDGQKEVRQLPVELIQLILQNSVEQIYTVDADGRLPLHIIAASRNSDKAKVKQVIFALVQLYPEAAAIPDFSGKLPLTLALESGKGWDEGVHVLLDAYPDAVFRCDLSLRMYPFMIATGNDRISEEESSESRSQQTLDCTYRLLLRCPSLCARG